MKLTLPQNTGRFEGAINLRPAFISPAQRYTTYNWRSASRKGWINSGPGPAVLWHSLSAGRLWHGDRQCE